MSSRFWAVSMLELGSCRSRGSGGERDDQSSTSLTHATAGFHTDSTHSPRTLNSLSTLPRDEAESARLNRVGVEASIEARSSSMQDSLTLAAHTFQLFETSARTTRHLLAMTLRPHALDRSAEATPAAAWALPGPVEDPFPVRGPATHAGWARNALPERIRPDCEPVPPSRSAARCGAKILDDAQHAAAARVTSARDAVGGQQLSVVAIPFEPSNLGQCVARRRRPTADVDSFAHQRAPNARRDLGRARPELRVATTLGRIPSP